MTDFFPTFNANHSWPHSSNSNVKNTPNVFIKNYIFILTAFSYLFAHINLLQVADLLALFHCLAHVFYNWKYDKNNPAASCISYQSYPEATWVHSASWLLFWFSNKALME